MYFLRNKFSNFFKFIDCVSSAERWFLVMRAKFISIPRSRTFQTVPSLTEVPELRFQFNQLRFRLLFNRIREKMKANLELRKVIDVFCKFSLTPEVACVGVFFAKELPESENINTPSFPLVFPVWTLPSNDDTRTHSLW